MYDLKITGGTVVDGTGADRFRADIGVKDGRIVEVRRLNGNDADLEGEAADTLDATGRIVAPGFVDILPLRRPGQLGSAAGAVEPARSHHRGRRKLRRGIRARHSRP